MVWNKPFKARVAKKNYEKMADGAHYHTAAGNMRSPPRRQIVNWALDAWDSLDKVPIVLSFKSCVLSVACDGFQEKKSITTLNQPCNTGLDHLHSVQQVISASRAADLFPDITDSDVENAAPESSLIDISGNEIEIQ